MESFLKTGKLGSDASSSSSSASASASAPKKSASWSGKPSRKPTPWVEKYRPKTVDDVAYQDEVVAVLKKSLAGTDLPNLLFYGPPGTGKTSTILAAARDLFGSEMYRDRVLELNASDERGINVVRQKVKNFAQRTATATRRPDGQPCPPFKIIVLDEADSMTRDAQSALRRTMEKEGRSTRFCLICNYVSRIIEPLTSRCAKFRFKPLAKDVLIGRLEMIAAGEKVSVTQDAMEALLETSEGDLRKAITTLQSCARLKEADGEAEEEAGGPVGTAVTGDDVREMSGVVPGHWLDRLFDVCKKNSYEKLQAFVDDLMAEGYSVVQMIDQMHTRIVEENSGGLSDRQKSVVCEALAINEFRLLDGASEYLQLMDICALLMKTMADGA